jgi:hypothetical protein
MAKILVRDDWYEQVAPTAMYEGEFETIFLQNAGHVFPEFHVVPFKVLVDSAYGSAKPDLALVDRSYRNWWVVEVELSHHSLTGHVLPQIQVFATGQYSEQHAAHIARQSAELNPSLITDMLKGQPPNVLVVVNAPRPDWAPVLKRFGALVTVFEVFRSGHGRQVFRLNGEQPLIPSEMISFCEFDRLLPKFLRVLSPASLPASDGDILQILYQEQVTLWKRVDASDAVWLVPLGPNPLTPGGPYQIILAESGDLSISSTKKER